MNFITVRLPLMGGIAAAIFYAGAAFGECENYLFNKLGSVPSSSSAKITTNVFRVMEGSIPLVVTHAISPSERGKDLALLLGTDAASVLRTFGGLINKTSVAEDTVARDKLWHEIDPDVQEEMQSFAQAANVKLNDLILANTFVDLVKHTMGCTTLIGKTDASSFGYEKDTVLFSRNLDYKSLNVLDKGQFVLVVKSPRGRDVASFASVSWPGLFGVFSGMNEYGVAIAVNELYTRGFNSGTPPYAFILRKVLEKSRNFNEAFDLLKKSRFSSSIIVSLADAERFETIELTPSAENGQPITRLIATDKIKGVSYATNYSRATLSVEADQTRDIFIQKTLNESETLTCDTHFKVLKETKMPGLNLQSMIMIPSTREIYLRPAKQEKYIRIGLSKYF